ncbi:MAG: NAD(P)/FAD-dependent oxidoreductase [Nitrososphaerota archaeon]|nr:NAD(P)/FAD-dependent oxidoreductase [Candidatus Bathyarchaeota archaeon]MDW8193754.1 NAD(P)/FAD-dependent oxidoreductase [Nitrososphaerota archaeon]
MEYDVIVVGAGTAGCLAAKTTAEAGLKVCLIERKRRGDVGRKICGDALGEHHLRNVGLEKPQHGELETRIEGVRIYSPDLETAFTVEHEDFSGYMLNRHSFGQWLLNMCLDRGVDLMDSTQCLEPIIDGSCVKGVLVKNMKTGGKFHVYGKVIVDASGFLGVIRRKLPPEMNIENSISNGDVEACYREIRQLKEENDEAEYCEIYLNQKVTPGGYTWIFPKSGAKVNVGLGVCMREEFPNPKDQLYRHVLTRPVFEGSTLVDGGAWYDPTRRPLDNMVGNGVIIVGDAACLVNPIHGGGIGPSMLSGYLAGKTIIEAVEEGDVSQNALWQYNIRYMEQYGAKQASLDVFRMLLLTCKDEDLNYGMKYKLLTEEDVLKAGLGEEFRLNITETTRRVFRGIRRVRFLNRLRVAVNLMRRVKAHYRSYPASPSEFGEWQMGTLALFREAKSKLMAE